MPYAFGTARGMLFVQHNRLTVPALSADIFMGKLLLTCFFFIQVNDFDSYDDRDAPAEGASLDVPIASVSTA